MARWTVCWMLRWMGPALTVSALTVSALTVSALTVSALTATTLSALPAGDAPRAAAAERVVARFAGGGVITAGDVASWRLVYGEPERAPTDATDAELEAIALQTMLARAAEERGLADRADVRMASWWFEVSLLEEELRRHWAAELTLPEETLEAAVAEAGDRFDTPRRVRLRNLLVAVPEDADEATRARLRRRADELRRQIVAGVDVATLARQVSDSQSRWRDGLVGWIKSGMLDPELETIAFGLQPGEVSEVVTVPRGFLLLFCEDVQEAREASPGEVRAKTRRQLRRRALLDRLAELRAEALDAARIDLDALHATPGPQVVGGPEGGASTAVVSPAVVSTADGWRLDVFEARALVALGGGEDDHGDAPSAARARLDEAVYRRHAAAVARREGLADAPRAAALLLWTRRARLTALETRVRVEARFEPLEPADVRAYFERHRARYRQPETMRLGLIRVSAPAAELRERSATLERVARRIAAGRLAFEDAAREHSELPSAARGGTTTWLGSQQIASLGPTVSKAIQSLDEGETSGLVRQGEGLRGDSTLWIVRRMGRRPPRDRTFEEARERAASELGTERARALQAEIHRELVAALALRRVESSPSASGSASGSASAPASG